MPDGDHVYKTEGALHEVETSDPTLEAGAATGGPQPDTKLDTKPDDDDDLQVVKHHPRLLLVLLYRGKHGERQAHEDEAEDEGVVAHGCLQSNNLTFCFNLKEVKNGGL